MEKPRWLGKDDTILTAYAERCAGPGWSNKLYWCVVQDGDKKVRIESLQIREMTEGMQTLLPISIAVQAQLAFELSALKYSSKT